MTKQRNGGLRKRCGCPRKNWTKCSHPWHFNFKWNGEHFRFSLEHQVKRLIKVVENCRETWKRDLTSVGPLISGRTEAEREAERLRTGIRNGSLLAPVNAPVLERLTLAQLFQTYRKRYLEVERKSTLKNVDYQIRAITRTALEQPDGTKKAFGEWLVSDISTDAVEALQVARRRSGITAANRDLGLLRATFNWAVRKKLMPQTPFKVGTEVVIRLKREPPRQRRLEPGEAERLLAACGPHLRAVVEAALETGMRRGEILSLQWWQVKTEPKAQIHLPASKTKTSKDRWIPISARLQLLLDMRRTDPEGKEMPPDAFVFGNEIGERVDRIDRAWRRAVLEAHGYKAEYAKRLKGEGRKPTRTAGLSPESRAQLKAINLHFHDLRREAGSRWLEGGVPIHIVRDWLGHTSVAQTSTYLAGTVEGQHEAMKRFDAGRDRVQPSATESEKRGHERPQPATSEDRLPQFSSENPQ